MDISTPAFQDHGSIPQKYTCQGEDVSPALRISDVPQGTKSFALIVDDPDAPSGIFVHWVAWNIPGNTQEIEEGKSLGNQGRNDFGQEGYRGPCPPKGKAHHYHFKMYALDTTLKLHPQASKLELEDAMKGHILATSLIIGFFQR
jgi:Raf kinase inhibitor-like YbhB/YbcL family protein